MIVNGSIPILRLAIGLIIFACACAVQAVGQAPQVQAYQLPNGLQLIVQEDHRAPVAILQIWYKVGSSYEHHGITGISHVLEHMMFKGTPRYPEGEFSRLIIARGGKLNATTTEDYTYYYVKLPIAHLPLVFALEADRMQNLTFEPTAFAKELAVVINERRLRVDDNPSSLAYERFNAAAYVASPYHHLTIGWLNDLKNLQLEAVKQWYRTWYAPNNAIIVVVGDVQPQAMFNLAKQYFAQVPSKRLPLLQLQQDVEPLGTRQVIVQKQAQLPNLTLGYNVPSLLTATQPEEVYALAVIAKLLGGSLSARLQQHLVQGQALASEVAVDYDPYARLSTLFILQATPTAKHTIAELQQALLAQIKILQDTLVKPEELARVRAQTIARYVYRQDEITDQATLLGRLASVGLPWQERDAYVAKIQAVTAEQIQAVAKLYFVPERLTVAELQPKGGQ